MVIYFRFKFRSVSHNGWRLSQTYILVPFVPRTSSKIIFQSHIKSKVPYPAVSRWKIVYIRSGFFIAHFKRLSEKKVFQKNDLIIINIAVSPACHAKPVRIQKTLSGKFLKIDKKRVAGKYRKAWIRWVSAVRRPHRQYLPVFLAGGTQKIHKLISLPAECPDAVLSGKGKNRHNYSACSHHNISPSKILFNQMTLQRHINLLSIIFYYTAFSL